MTTAFSQIGGRAFHEAADKRVWEHVMPLTGLETGVNRKGER